MVKGVLSHKPGSIYDDFPEERYQFPKRYLSRLSQMIGDWIVYYEPGKQEGARVYKAVAKIASIDPDNEPGLFVARMAPNTYLPFDKMVSWQVDGTPVETGLRKPDGNLDRGAVQWAVRLLTDTDFATIVARGLVDDLDMLPRVAAQRHEIDEEQPPFLGLQQRDRVLVERAVRDRVFRKLVLNAYDARCTLTGLKLINGGGRAEVEAAHIMPVEAKGPDTVRNGLALSGTIHWLFDRGLVSLSDDHEILVSRQANDPDSIWQLINPTRRALPPRKAEDRPHPRYLAWHREHRFKA
jgi:putative restriction endonuclease